MCHVRKVKALRSDVEEFGNLKVRRIFFSSKHVIGIVKMRT